MLAAGPSFQKHIPWLQENHSKFIIVSVPPLLSKLEELGIKPDIITHLDGFDFALPHITKIKDFSFFDNAIALFGAFTQSRIADRFKKENIYFIEGPSAYKEGFGRFTTTNVGAYSLGLLLICKIKNIYLLGLDFALDQESGHTHSQMHSYSAPKELKESTDIAEAVQYTNTVIKIKGNFADEVFTTVAYNDMRKGCNTLIEALKAAETNLYNLSDGAYINDTIPTNIDDMVLSTYPFIDKKALFTDMQAVFDSYSETYLKPSEVDALEPRILYCSKLIAIMDTHLHTPHPTLDQFNINLLTMFRDLFTEPEDIDIARILLLYFEYVSGYLMDLINTKEIENPKRMIKHINKSVIPQMKRIIEYVKERLVEYQTFEKERQTKEV